MSAPFLPLGNYSYYIDGVEDPLWHSNQEEAANKNRSTMELLKYWEMYLFMKTLCLDWLTHDYELKVTVCTMRIGMNIVLCRECSLSAKKV